MAKNKNLSNLIAQVKRVFGIELPDDATQDDVLDILEQQEPVESSAAIEALTESVEELTRRVATIEDWDEVGEEEEVEEEETEEVEEEEVEEDGDDLEEINAQLAAKVADLERKLAANKVKSRKVKRNRKPALDTQESDDVTDDDLKESGKKIVGNLLKTAPKGLKPWEVEDEG